ncbi:MAG: hypothetical protein WA667_18800 [Candidatus Nitrosopolaris sp.]
MKHHNGHVYYIGKTNGATIAVLQDPRQYRTSGRIIDPSTQTNSETRFRTDSTGLNNNINAMVVSCNHI